MDLRCDTLQQVRSMEALQQRVKGSAANILSVLAGCLLSKMDLKNIRLLVLNTMYRCSDFYVIGTKFMLQHEKREK